MARQEFITLNFDRRELEQFFAQMQVAYGANSKQIEQAKLAALNYAARGWKKEGLNIVKMSLALKNPAKHYNKNVSVQTANSGRPYIKFRGRGLSSLPLSDFDFKKNLRPGQKGGRAASARVLKDSPRKMLEKDGRKGFVFKGQKSGKVLLGERTGEKGKTGREKIKVFYAHSLLDFMDKPNIRQKLLDSAYAQFKQRFEHDLNAVMSGWMRPVKRRR